MNVILAILSFIVFAIGIPILFYNQSKYGQYLAEYGKKKDDLKEKIKQAIAKDDYVLTRSLKKQLEEYESETNVGFALGCMSLLLSIFGQITVAVLSFLVMVIALTSHVGLPIIGYIAFILWLGWLVLGLVIAPKINTKDLKAAKAIGNTYIPRPKSFLARILTFTPSIYSLYIFLIVIGLLA